MTSKVHSTPSPVSRNAEFELKAKLLERQSGKWAKGQGLGGYLSDLTLEFAPNLGFRWSIMCDPHDGNNAQPSDVGSRAVPTTSPVHAEFSSSCSVYKHFDDLTENPHIP